MFVYVINIEIKLKCNWFITESKLVQIKSNQIAFIAQKTQNEQNRHQI